MRPFLEMSEEEMVEASVQAIAEFEAKMTGGGEEEGI